MTGLRSPGLVQQGGAGAGLQQAEISPVDDVLGLLQALQLLRPGGLARVVVLHVPVAVAVELRQVLGVALGGGHGIPLLALEVQELGLGLGEGALLLAAGGGVGGALGLAVRDEGLVVLLCVLLHELILLHLLLQVLNQHVHQPQDTSSVRLGVALHLRGGLRRVAVRANLHEGFLLLLLLRLLVVLGVVELVQAVLRHAQQLQGRVVVRGLLGVVLVLLLAHGGGLLHGGVQLLDGLVQGGDLGLGGGDGVLRGGDAGGGAVELVLELLALVLGLVDLGLAERHLLIVVLLLLLQGSHHLVNQGGHLLESLLLAAQRHHDQVRAGAVLHGLQGGHHTLGHLAAGSLDLQQRRRRQGLLEQLQSLIRVEHLDGVRDSDQLLPTRLLGLLLLLRGLRAVVLQPGQEPLVSGEGGLGLLQVPGLGGHLDGEVAGAGGLLLDGGGGGGDLLVLGGDHAVVGGDGLVLRGGNLIQAGLHLIPHLLQDPHNLPGGRGVPLPALQERRHRLLILVRQHSAVLRQPRHRGSPIRLQERRAHPLLNRRHRAGQRLQVGLEIPGVAGKLRGLLGPHLLALLQGVLGRGAVLLALLHRRPGLGLRGLGGLDVVGEAVDGCQGLLDGGVELALVALAIALELGVELLGLLALGLHLLLEALQQRHHPPNRVGRGLLAAGGGDGASELVQHGGKRGG
mmetsp:Transcript_39/g.87  ORF Transcript_39/g.87 Transcript_39/m.87 type:complete len:685 (+) Transcript_39:40-2094(+)